MLNRRHGLNKAARVVLSRSVAPSTFATARFYSSSSEPTNVAVLGGGITGLATAHYLSKSNPNTKITIYESSPRLGGWVHSEKVEIDDGHIIFEKGPRTLRTPKNGALTGLLIGEFGLQDETIITYKTAPAATNRYLYYPDHIVRVPQPDPQLGLFGNALVMAYACATKPAFQGIVGSVFLEPLRPVRPTEMTDESVGDFFARRFGHRLVDQVMSAVLHGIYAGDIYQLSMKSLFPYMWKLEREYGSLMTGMVQDGIRGRKHPVRDLNFVAALKQTRGVLSRQFIANLGEASVFTFRNGMQQLIDSLVASLREKPNVAFQLSKQVDKVQKDEQGMTVQCASPADRTASRHNHSHVISTLSADKTLQVASAANTALLDLPICPSPTVMTVNLYFRTPGLHSPGFGYLIPLATPIDQNPERGLGVVFDTAYSASTPQDSDFMGPMQDTVSKRGTKVTVMLGGHYWDGWSSYPSNDEGLQMALSLLQRHLGITEKPAAHSVNLNHQCIPQYTVGFEDRVRKVHDELSARYSGSLRVAGNWVEGVGVNDCVRSGWEAAQGLSTPGLTGLEHIVEPQKWAKM